MAKGDIKSPKTTVYALRDLCDRDGNVVHRKGDPHEVYHIDAREHLLSKNWGSSPPPMGDEVPADPPENGDVPFDFDSVPGLSKAVRAALIDAGYVTAEAIDAATVEELSEIQGIGVKLAERLKLEVAG